MGIFKEHVEGREEEPALTAGGPATAKGSEGMGKQQRRNEGSSKALGASEQGHEQPHFPGSSTDEFISA